MTPKQNTGRIILVSIICLVLAISLLAIGLFLATQGTERLSAQVVRFALTICLCAWLYRGSPIAKWICIALFSVAGALTVVPLLRASDVSEIAIVGVVGMVYFSFATVLVSSTSVNEFLTYQRGKRVG